MECIKVNDALYLINPNSFQPSTAVAADLSIRGHMVTLIKTSNAMHDENFNYLSQFHNTKI